MRKKSAWSRLWRARGGLGAVEFALIAPALLTLLLGVLDFGRAYWEQMQIANAADAGAQWGMSNSYNADSIRSVARSATNLASQVGVSSSYSCGCATNSGVTLYGAAPNCTTCPDGSTAKPYIIVNTHVCYSTIFSWPGLGYCTSGDSSCSSCARSQVVLSSQSVVLK